MSGPAILRTIAAMVPPGSTLSDCLYMQSALMKKTSTSAPFGIPGSSPAVQMVREQLHAAVEHNASIVFSGEPGVGKRTLAQYLHDHYSPSNAPFVELTPRTDENELRAILFDEDRKRIEGMLGHSVPRLSDGCTLFIRNIHQFSLLTQTRIVRFLLQRESGTLQGASRVRLIFSMPMEWTELLKDHVVIESLLQPFERFSHIHIPALRERREDIPETVQYLLCLFPEGTRPVIDKGTLEHLTGHDWVDNMRELRGILEEGVKCSNNGTSFTLPATFVDEMEKIESTVLHLVNGKRIALEDTLSVIEQALIRRALVRSEYDRGKAAVLLGVSELNLRYRIKKYDIYLPDPVGGAKAGAKKSGRRS